MNKFLNFFFCIILLSSYLKAEKTIVLSGIAKSSLNSHLEKIVQEAYLRAGFKITINNLPAQRALNHANNGKVDGELARTSSIEQTNNNLIRIPVAIYTFKVISFTKNTLKINSKRDFKDYKIGIILGFKKIENYLNEYKYTAVNNSKQLFDLLNLKRVDIAIIGQTKGLETIKKFNLKNITINNTPLINSNLYHYVHKKNKKLVPILTKIFKEMKSSGTIKKYNEDYLKKLPLYKN